MSTLEGSMQPTAGTAATWRGWIEMSEREGKIYDTIIAIEVVAIFILTAIFLVMH